MLLSNRIRLIIIVILSLNIDALPLPSAKQFNLEVQNNSDTNLTFIPRTQANPSNCVQWNVGSLIRVSKQGVRQFVGNISPCGRNYEFSVDLIAYHNTGNPAAGVILQCASNTKECTLSSYNFPLVLGKSVKKNDKVSKKVINFTGAAADNSFKIIFN